MPVKIDHHFDSFTRTANVRKRNFQKEGAVLRSCSASQDQKAVNTIEL
jgi:hypothetical protein